MLTRLLVVVDAVLLLTAGWLGVHLYRVGTTTPASAPAPASVTPEPKPGPAIPPAPAPLSAFAVVAERNLFSPNRSESMPEPPKPATAGPAAAPPGPKPRLYGVVLDASTGPRAFLEDPRTRKVFGYGIGDSVADSRVEQINADRVLMRRGSESFEVLLRDPSKPKPAPAPPPTMAVPGAPTPGVPPTPGAIPPPGRPGAPVFPGQIPGQGSPETPQAGVPAQPATPGQPPLGPVPAPGSIIPGRRQPPRPPGAPALPAQPQPSGDAGS